MNNIYTIFDRIRKFLHLGCHCCGRPTEIVSTNIKDESVEWCMLCKLGGCTYC